MRHDEYFQPWPFYQWGINLVGPFPEAPGRVKFLLNIKQQFTSLAHLQANGQIEVTNRTLLQGLKTRLGKAQAFQKGYEAGFAYGKDAGAQFSKLLKATQLRISNATSMKWDF
ncbi:reverse transcriptase domain-containing protein [Tanacetum coccineum]